MTKYSSWLKNHEEKCNRITKKLQEEGLQKDEVIDYFTYENMQKKELEFCPLYIKNQKCHKIENLNCFLCACPSFRFCDNGIIKKGEKIQMSTCAISSKYGRFIEVDNKIHQDCSNCTIPHQKKYIEKFFDFNWSKITKWCEDK